MMDSSPTVFQQQGVPLSNFNDHSFQTTSPDKTSAQTITKNRSEESYTLNVDFTWMKWKAIITAAHDQAATPIYIVNFKAFKPNIVFKSIAEDADFATGSLHPISINHAC